jgi:RNA polymerase sigma factor (sigma-70 family)
MADDMEIYDTANEGKDYILQIKVRNGPLLRAYRMRGFRSLKQLSVAAGISYQSLLKYFSLQKAPITKSGGWARNALALAKTLRLPPDSLFPEHHLDKALAKSSGEIEVSRDELMLMMADHSQQNPEEKLISDQSTAKLMESFSCLTPREERVLRMRFGLGDDDAQTHDAVALKLQLTRERIRQIENKAIRKIRHPDRLRKLASAGVTAAEHEISLIKKMRKNRQAARDNAERTCKNCSNTSGTMCYCRQSPHYHKQIKPEDACSKFCFNEEKFPDPHGTYFSVAERMQAKIGRPYMVAGME